MCAKLNVENGSAPTSGCFSENRGGRVIEVCVCQSNVGDTPCNTGSNLVQNLVTIILGTALVWVLYQWDGDIN